MHALDFIVQPAIAPNRSLATDAQLLHLVRHPSRTRLGVLRVYDFPGDVLSLGRYHIAPTVGDKAVQMHRRYSGGRVIPCGHGFVGMALALPHRSALFSDDPLALAPHQVINRYVRGILAGCQLVGVPAFYPGRDVVTVDRRMLALVAFEVTREGAFLFEAILANQKDFSVLPAMLDVADPMGVIKAEILMADQTTCLTEIAGKPLTTEEVAELLRRGYQQELGLALTPHVLTPLEHRAIEATANHQFQEDRWLYQRRVRPELDRYAFEHVQLGMFETYFALEQERFIKDISLIGDFIANSPAIEQLERELRLCPANRRSVDAVVSRVLAEPTNYLLGLGGDRTIVDTICKGLPE